MVLTYVTAAVIMDKVTRAAGSAIETEMELGAV